MYQQLYTYTNSYVQPEGRFSPNYLKYTSGPIPHNNQYLLIPSVFTYTTTRFDDLQLQLYQLVHVQLMNTMSSNGVRGSRVKVRQISISSLYTIRGFIQRGPLRNYIRRGPPQLGIVLLEIFECHIHSSNSPFELTIIQSYWLLLLTYMTALQLK